VVAPTTNDAPVVTVGANFVGSNIAISGFVPPDSDGAVGPSQFVELVNGVYRVYDKSGTILQQLSLDQFWSSAGATPHGSSGDPRILYDPESQRWFAAALDFSSLPPNSPSAYLLAVSNPTSSCSATFRSTVSKPSWNCSKMGRRSARALSGCS
jgi:hypothetical protein